MLRLERVSKFYSGNGLVSTGFSKVDLEFDVGEFVAITGESGSGKSTLLNVISGLDSYEEGEMFINGQPTSGFSKEDLEDYRKRYIGSIFQTFNLINSYSVYQNVELVLLMSGYDKKEIPAKVREIIAKVGLSEYEKTKASKLSGGQKQRVAIARALAKETPIIIADEPTGNLDSKAAAEIIELLHQLSKDKLIIIVTHNYDQVEPYVTRKITMYDGHVAEDKRLGEKNLSGESKAVTEARAGNLSFGNMIRLGLRNTFNLPAKFCLLLIVFLFLCLGVTAQYSAFMNLSDTSFAGYNNYFMDTGGDRVLFTRQDGKALTDEDYEKVGSISGVEKIVEDDILLDAMVNVVRGEKGESYYIDAQVAKAADYESHLTEGRMPENSREAILIVSPDSYAADIIEEFMEKEWDIQDQRTSTPLVNHQVKIVGYGLLTEAETTEMDQRGQYCEGYVCVEDTALADIKENLVMLQSTQEIEFAGHIMDGWTAIIRANSNVPEGEIFVPESVSSWAEGSAVGQTLSIKNESIYFTDDFDFTVGDVYTQDNLSQVLGLENYEEISGCIFISPRDYSKIFDKENYQSSAYAESERKGAGVAAAIEAAGYDVFRVNEGVVDSSGGFSAILDVVYTIILAGLLIVMFFITYFITKLILKSRNVYFSTIRMLGATKENCDNLLRTELFAVLNIAFFLTMGVFGLVKAQIIKVATLQQMVSYLGAGDLVILYVVLCLMSLILATRYAKQLFKKTAMNAYKEEV